ncbi:MAG: tripartite tricarboxylate transporter substrate binding protein [Hylemonella sp.]
MQRRQMLLAAAALPVLTQAQSVPVRILVGAPAGGSTDTLARSLASELGSLLNRAVIVENRSGAGGNIAAEVVAKSIPDGNTLLLSFTSHAINASLYANLPFDPVRDFTPLTCVATSPSVLVAHPSLPVNNVRELIVLARQKPGKLNFAIGALGSSLHLAGELFKMQAGVYIVNIPYRGTAPAIADVLAGQVELMFAAIGNAQSHVRAGKLKALGVTSLHSISAFPDVAPIAQVLPAYESSAWFGLFGPARMSPDLVSRISEATRRAIDSPQVRRRIEAEGARVVANSPEEFGLFVQSEIKRWARVVRYSGAQAT